MTHITESRVIGNHAEMGESAPGDSNAPMTVRREEADAAESTWDSEGGR
jgi:hypothetical protein